MINRKWKKGQSGIRSGRLFQCLAVAMALSLSVAPLSVMAEVKEEIIYTADGLEDYMAESAKRKSDPVQTNSDPDWPQGPAVSAAGAIIMDADSGAVLYGKNIYKHLYPASITKVMTALLAYENLKPSDTVRFSENAVFGIEFGSSNIGMDAGESITVDQALYGLMVASANEVAIALGERVSGTEEGFRNLMNERAAQLGCNNTNFVTLNGLHDKNHYTCVYDMALIAREAFRHPDLIKYMSQGNYHFEPSENQPDEFWIGNTNDFLNGAISYDGVIGGKTGYTDEARETLVTFAERDGKRLICVIMKDEPPLQYHDTIDLLNYAFDNFQKVNIAENENRFTMQSGKFLSFGTDIFGNASSSYRIPEEASMLIPMDLSFEDLSAEIVPMETAVPEDAEAPQEEAGSPEDAGENSAEADTADANAPSADQAADAPPEKEKPSAENTDPEDFAPAAPTGMESPEVSGFTQDGERILGTIYYKYHDYNLGSAQVLFNPGNTKDSSTDNDSGKDAAAADTELQDGSSPAAGNEPAPVEIHGIRSLFFELVHTGAHGSVYLNILLLIPLVLAAAFLLCIFFFIHGYFAGLKRRRQRRNRRAARDGQSSRRKQQKKT